MRILAAIMLMSLGLAGCATPTETLDTDGDGLDDQQETALGTDPNQADTDGDGILDAAELDLGTDPLRRDDKPALAFRPVVDLGSKAYPVAAGTSCNDSVDDGDCGLGEPTVEVAGDGTIYVSGVCCIGNAPPIYVSRDGGETFHDMPGDDVRELFGIEMDFAIDEVGTFYAADIEFAGSFQVTVWDKDGNYMHHAKWPAVPIVDRDWIRAEGDGVLYFIYNAVTVGSVVYKSTDHGQTWGAPIHTVDYGLANAAIMPGKELCLFGGDLNGFRRVDCTIDGGTSWTSERSSLPNGRDSYPVGAYDEAGNLWLAETQSIAEGNVTFEEAIAVTYRSPDGAWHDVVRVSPEGRHRMPWITAGAEGAVALAWYGTPGTTTDGDWFLHAAATSMGTETAPTWDAVVVDPEPVFQGSLGRDLLDFLQIDMGPEGALHIAYSKQNNVGPDGNEEQLQYVRSEPSPLAMADFFYGPH